ncbi:hypothetical protein H5410_000277 [Solanum commersonii]|uniref:Leucine-rich repeat-containing N-terminal plant-type domain-containing protein n=1 Tax=Solanum commersonii TaxID=4109 RepID=A0A9J6AVP5_SOLCO|nr:hypothetical protein H5410_000277 [Solanum commersonii]
MGCVKLTFFMQYTFLSQLAFSSSLPHLCPEDQALALLQFKNLFTIDSHASDYCYDISTGQVIQSYPRTLLWNKSTNCCSWDGVHCDEMTGQVIELDLRCSQLRGKFHSNSSLFQLFNLKRLDLSHNDFTGSLISPKFGEFSSLMHLDLSSSRFTGIIPSEICHLYKLHVLRFSDQYGLSVGPHNFELLLKNLTQLRELNLNSVNISSTIPLNFSSYLTNLQLLYTELHGVLPERVFHLSNLEYLDLSKSPQLTVTFPTTKWNSSASLMRLYLNSVNFTGSIPESFSHLTSLLNLDMGYSNLSGTIPKPLWNLTNIESLNLGDNHLEGPISQFSIFEKLKDLSLRNNNFDGQLEFLSFNRSWMQLESLEISSNYLTGPIPSIVSGLQNLRALFLSSNNLNGTIPSWIFSLPSLVGLDLSSNTFSGKIQEFKSKTFYAVILNQNKLEGPIPKSLLNQQVRQDTILVELDQEEEDSPMISWQEVLMGYGCGLVIGLSVIYIMLSTHYPAWLSRIDLKLEHIITTRMKKHKKKYYAEMGCVKLVSFMLYPFFGQLAFSSSLPHLCPEDQALALLQFKHMSYPRTLLWNKSTDCCSWDGIHYDEMTGQVIELDLCCSQLQGKFHSNSSLFQLSNIIPSEISHLSKLHVLRISGLYELSLGLHNFELLLKNLTQLRELNLDYVNISSTIPLNFSTYLKTLSLLDTQLRGVLSERVFHLSDLESLDLSENPQLTVRFPTTKWNSSASLMKLYLYDVNITGRIPESFSHLTSLHELYMGYTNLSGPIPKPLWNLTHIESLFLDHNHLEGPISQFSRFEKLKKLSLGNNNFDGRLKFLSFIRSWAQLEWLVLSSNSLTGPIPSTVSGLQNLKQLYLSSNYLNGTIRSWIFSLPSLRGFKSKTLYDVSLRQNKLEGPIPKVPQVTIPVELDKEEEEDSPMISWQAVLMGYGCGLVIGLSLIYIMLSTQYPTWFSRLVVQLEHRITTRLKKHQEKILVCNRQDSCLQSC